MTQAQSNPQSSWIGQTIANRYQIEAILGQGGMSTVYKAADPNLKRSVAIKIIHPHLSVDPEFVRRFEQEAAAVAQLRHPHIIQVYDFDHDGATYYMVLEHVHGKTLQAKLKSLNASGQRFSARESLRIMSTIADAVAYAHESSMIHRDLKPSNVMLNFDEEPILMDFGVAKMLGDAQHTATGAVVGTAKYMSPEQAQGQRPDERADIYSLGVMLYEMVAGQPPFGGESAVSIMMKHVNEPLPDLRQLRQDTPDELIAVIEKALAKSPDYRYQRALDLGASLKAIDTAILAAVPSTSRPRTPTSEALTSVTPPPAFAESKPVQQSGLPKWAIGVGAAILVVGLVAVVAFSLLGGALYTPNVAEQVVALAKNSDLPTSENMVRIGAGTYMVGLEEADGEHAPRQEVELDEFWIDQFEVTNAQYAQFLEGVGDRPKPSSWSDGEIPAGQESHPVKGITWNMAAAYCRWAKKRLPTETEWEVAARGSQELAYPWGDEERAVELPRAGTYEVGSIPTNRSPFGAFDMAGNVWEWVDEPYAPVNEGHRVLRGGAFGFLQDMAYRLQGDPNVPTMSATSGARCAADEVIIIEDEGVLYADDFADPESGWPELAEEGQSSLFGYHPPAFYHVEVSVPVEHQVVTRGPAFDNFTVESLLFVEKTDTETGDFRYGLALQRSGENYYAFAISNRTRRWYVLKSAGDELEILDEGTSDSIQGHDIVAADKLRVDSDEGTFTFSINDEPVSQIIDTDYTKGEVGFFVENFDESMSHIHYDALTIREVEPIAAAFTPVNVLYADDFADPESGWPELAEEGQSSLFGYHPPAFYHVEVSVPKASQAVTRGPDFDNVTVESDVFVAKTETETDDFRYGLVLRRVDDNYYAFTVSSRSKRWAVLKSSAAGLDVLAQGRDEGIQGQASEHPNKLRVDAKDDSFIFHINQRLVVQISDGDYPGGEVGFFVENFDESMSHIHYDTLTIREVEFEE